MKTSPISRLSAGVAIFCVLIVAAMFFPPEGRSSCTAPSNVIEAENCKPGNPAGEWDISGAGDPSIQGFATDISVNRGETVHFKIQTDAASYRLDIYRIGYYGGNGARKVATVQPSAVLPQAQPACINDSTTKLTDCGNWAESASWTVPADAVSGVYVAKLIRSDTGGASHIIFIVRDDSGNADLLFKTSDTTWQAYNSYGLGYIEYPDYGYPSQKATKASYNRPFLTRAQNNGEGAYNWFFQAEYPMIRWLEANGYNVSYFTSVDADRRGADILKHKVYLSVGHDEYWSGQERANVEAARAAGVHLAFFGGNEIYRKIRWENAIDGSGTPYRTMVCYNESNAPIPIDPADPPIWTGTWRNPRFSPPADGGRPENALSGTLFTVSEGPNPLGISLEVSQANGRMRFWRNTPVASLPVGQKAILGDRVVGYEFDEDIDNGFRPAGLVQLSSTTTAVNEKLLGDNVNIGADIYLPGTATHVMTLYRAPSKALVFSAGTVQWSWGLDAQHDNGPSAPDPSIQQATVNILADMGAQPATLQPGLVTATPSADQVPPASVIASPSSGASLQVNSPITVAGTAADSGGGVVGGVEVSTDGGVTWHPAMGHENWSYTWIPTSTGSVTILSRAVDDSGNLETPSAGVSVTVIGTPSFTLWPGTTVPAVPDSGPDSAVELGVKFRSDSNGYITGIRFYKASTNTGTHVANIWTSSGTRLATATFANETVSGWQQVNFPTPVAISVNTVYVASYHTSAGHYSDDQNYFAKGVDSPPLHAPGDGVSGANGVYVYGATSSFPSLGWRSSNYWVDVVFTTALPTLSSITVTPVNQTIPTGTTQQFTASGTYSDGSTKELSTQATWASSNTGVATIGSSGLATAVSPGSTTISATLSGVTGSTTLTVQATPLTITTASLAGGTQGVPYTATVAASGGIPPYTWSVAGGSLPAGLTLNSATGGISGTPTATGTFNFTVGVADSATPPQNSTRLLSISINAGAPILIISSASNPFSRYYAEILRAEGFNAFDESDISAISSTVLDSHDIAILGEMPLTSGQVTMLTNWVNAGGRLIAMRPDKKLAGLLGLTDQASTLSNAYLLVNTSSGPGVGIVNQTMQFHGTADRYALSGAASLATLYSSATTATSSPAVTLRNVGTMGGQAAAFAYDLARSAVYTRQGNPAWSGQERDGDTVIRSDDLFYGAASFDPQPDWVDLGKMAIPQADEQQRLLANLVIQMNFDKKPLPRFWYFPRNLQAVVVMTGDDHAGGGTAGRFDAYVSKSPSGCSMNNWECIRSTSYIYTNAPLTDSQAAAYVANGFEVALHVDTNCADWTPSSLESFFSSQLGSWSAKYASLPTPATNRVHCVPWSDYATMPIVELNHGIRLDANYYYWPPSWVSNRPGFFTGSGIPMRFADSTGALIDVYQAPTQMTDESGQTYPFTIDTLLDRALGPEGYYGAFVANMHTDTAASSGSDAIVQSAQSRGIPVISAKQLLDWLDGRNASTFSSFSRDGNTLGFSVSASPGAAGLVAMVPVVPGQTVTRVTNNGGAIPFTIAVLNGTRYARFPAVTGTYQVSFAADVTPPAISGVVPANGATGVSTGTTVTVTFSEPMDPASINTNTIELRDPLNVLVPSAISYNTATQTATLVPTAPLANSKTYTAIIVGRSGGVKDLAGNPLANDYSWSFTTAPVATGPFSIWSGTTVPGVIDSGPDSPVELGVKFRADTNGFITGIRFYKSSTNTGTHVANLWTSSGTRLATATFGNETASGWQQVNFATPVAVTANTVYVASYHTNSGHYSDDQFFFAGKGVDTPPLHALADGVSGVNGVYAYGSTSSFPSQGWNSSNYWVDVVFQQ
ncbi:DUF4082 domain-containing protein [Geobacter sp.]|uniref:DUF4082 domain-containing protein n=1 Tax=Geobacter sp. TaxID=46610 RepID=UPI0026306CC1|nr:DUF4082 domain-containing protein [Geobacter sp.]